MIASLTTSMPTSSKIVRRIIHRTRGCGHGPIVRLMSPADLGEFLKPFVFLDLFDADADFGESLGLHPHSGIATITIIVAGNVRFDDPGSGQGVIDYGGVEWMRASGGVWHGDEMSRGDSARVRGYQLWIALPPELESGPVDSQYFEASSIPEVGPARLIIGNYAEAQSPVRAPLGINYLLVTLEAGERWRYVPPNGHDVAWLAVSSGQLLAPELVTAGEMAVFQNGRDAIDLEATPDGAAVFVLGSAVPHPHDLVLGHYSVHTNPEALRRGEANIVEIRTRSHTKGRILF